MSARERERYNEREIRARVRGREIDTERERYNERATSERGGQRDTMREREIQRERYGGEGEIH